MEKERTQSVMVQQTAGYRRLYEAYYGRVLAYCVRRVGRQEAVDLAAEVFAVAWRRLDAIPGGEKALAWLYGVAYRVVLRHRRTGERRGRLQAKLASLPPQSVAEPGQVVVQHRDYQLVLAAAARLKPRDREVLQSALWEELAHREIAEVMDSSVPAVRQRFHRAKRALAREYERLGGSLPPQQLLGKEAERED